MTRAQEHGSSFRDILVKLNEILAGRLPKQGNISTFYENHLRSSIRLIHGHGRSEAKAVPAASNAEAEAVITSFVELATRERFQDPAVRLGRSVREVVADMAIPWATYTASQGVLTPLTWQNHTIFKTAYDLAAYPMLIHELKPATVIELGSGSGGSAVWLADISSSLRSRPRVISVDLRRPRISDGHVEFLQGDIYNIGALFSEGFSSTLCHPWLVIEDAHVNVSQVLSVFHELLAPGDYLIVEDSLSKRAELLNFILERSNLYWLDSYYLDLFGENSTCAIDSILVRRPDTT
jgi:cephalosporin hydroxylase